MAGKSGTFTVRVVSDTKGAEKGLDQFASKVSTTGAKVENAGRKMTAFASVPVAAAMGVATKAASDLQQAVGGTEAVFGDASDAIDEFAKSAADNVALSEREFREATTSIGGQLKRMTGDVDLAAEQSIELTKVAADLAATYGGTTAEAVQALGAAFRGEADPAERFNLNLKIGAVNAKAVEMGLAATTAEVDDNARAQATLALIMEESADAQGQLARESDTAAVQMQKAKAAAEDAAAQLGAALLPIVADVAGGVAELAGAFGSLPEPVQNGVVALGLLLAAAGPVATAAGRLMTVWGKVGPAFDGASIGAYNMAGNIGRVNKALAGLATAVAAIEIARRTTTTAADAVDDLRESAGDTEQAYQDLRAAIEADTGAIGENTRALILNRLEALDLIGTFAEAGISIDEYAVALQRAADAGGDNAARLAAMDDIANRLAGSTSVSTREFANFAAANGVLTDQVGQAQQALRDVEAVAGEAGDAQGGAVGPTEDLGDAAKESARQHESLEDAMRRVTDATKANLSPLFAAQDALRRNQEAQWKVEEATNAVREAQENYNGVVAEFGRRSPEAQHALHEVEHAQRLLDDANRDTTRSAFDVKQATDDLAEGMRTGKVDIVAAKDELRSWAEQGLITEEQAAQVAGELDEVGTQARQLNDISVVIPVDADTSGFINKVTGLYQDHYGEVSVRLAGGGVIRHSGGPVQEGHAYLTGGRGREELFVPHDSGMVLSHAKTKAALSGQQGVTNQITVNLNGGDHDASSVASHIAWMLAR